MITVLAGLNMKASPTERVAGCAFFLFTLLQVPYFIVDTNLAPHGMLELSPLQVTVANLAKTFPSHTSVLEYVLVPGGWVRGPLSYFIRCQFKTGGKGLCDAERARVTDLEFVIKNNLPIMVKLLETEGMSQQMPILYGSTMIVVASIFSLYYSVKTAVLGFALLAFGVVQVGQEGTSELPRSILLALNWCLPGYVMTSLGSGCAAGVQWRSEATGD